MFKCLCFLGFIAASGPAFADTVLKCDFPNDVGAGGWAAGPVIMHHKDGAATATVNSAVVNEFIGEPIEVKVIKDVPGQLVLSWEVKIVDKAKQYTRMKFKLNVLNGGAMATYTAQPLAYDNAWRSEGACVRVKG